MKKLEIGSGSNPRQPWSEWYHNDLHIGDFKNINDLINAFPHIEINCPAWEIALPDNSLDEVYMSGVWEHFFYKDIEKMIDNIHRMLEPGGILDVREIPDAISYVEEYLNGIATGAIPMDPVEPKHIFVVKSEMKWLLRALYGWQRYPGDEHKSYWNEEIINIYLKDKFEVLEITSSYINIDCQTLQIKSKARHLHFKARKK